MSTYTEVFWGRFFAVLFLCCLCIGLQGQDIRFTSCFNVADNTLSEGASIDARFSLRNYGSTPFSGTIRAILRDPSNNNINQQIGTSTTGIGVGQTKNYRPVTPITLPPGQYQLIIVMDPDAGGDFLPSSNGCSPTTSGTHYATVTVNTCSDGRSLTLTAPASGATLARSTAYTYRWNSDQLGSGCKVLIIYRIGDSQTGTRVPGMPASGINDTGSFPSTLPMVVSDDVQFFIYYVEEDNDGTIVGDDSDNCRLVVPPCSDDAVINLTRPTSNTTLTAGQPYTIEWTGTRYRTQCPVDITYRVNNGSLQTIATETSDDGSFLWNVPSNINSRDVDLAVSYAERRSDGSGNGSSVNNFDVITPVEAPTINSPVDQTSFPASTASVTYRWSKNNSSGIANYFLRLVDVTNGGAAVVLDDLNVGDASSYTHSYNYQPGRTYQWRVLAINQVFNSDRAEQGFAQFTIADAPQSVNAPSLLSPTSNQVLQPPVTSQLFSWRKNNPTGYATYELRVVNDSNNDDVIFDQNVGDIGSYNLSHNFAPGATYRWIVRAVNSANSSDIQESGAREFEIENVADRVTIISPQSGTYSWNESIPVSWTTTGNIAAVNIEIEPNGDGLPILLRGNVANTGSQSATVSADYCIKPGSYRLKIYETGGDASSVDYSSGIITIEANNDHAFTVTTPAAGATYNAGDALGAIRWTDVGIPDEDDVILELVKGSNYTTIGDPIVNTIPNSGVYDGYVLNQNLANGTDYAIRISNAGCSVNYPAGSVVGYSGYFTITSTYTGTCTGCTAAGLPDQELNAAISYLCSNCVIDPQSNGDYFVQEGMLKQDIAKMLFAALFQENDGVNTACYSDDFPTPFVDMYQQDAQPYHRYGKAIAYLQYSDAITGFTRRNLNFNPLSTITRGQFLKVLCETFNVNVSSSYVPFGDVPESHPEQRYIAELFDRDVITNQTYFRPNDAITRGEAFLFLYRFMTDCDDCLNNKLDDPMDAEAFYDPGNYTPGNLGRHPSLSDGNFDSYSATGLYLADRGMPMVFSFSYNSYLTELPNDVFTSEPLGCGWSHSYHAFIKKIPGASWREGDFIYTTPATLAVVWPGGSMHYYKDEAGFEKITKGNYDEISFVNGEYRIKKKNQVEFVFRADAGAEQTTYYLRSITDRNGNTIRLQYQNFTKDVEQSDGTTESQILSKLTKVTGTTGRHFNISYHADKPERIQSVTDQALNRSITFDYSGPSDQLWKYTDAEQQRTDYAYNPNEGNQNLLQYIRLPEGNVMTNTYEDGKVTASTTNNASSGLAQTVNVDWSLSSGGGTSSTMRIADGSGAERDYTYITNADGKIEEIETQGNDADVEYTDPDNPTLPTKITVRDGPDGRSLKTEYQYDDDGNVLRVEQEEDVIHTFTYTDMHDVETYRNPRSKTTTFGYTAGNLTSIAAPIGTTTMGYDGDGQVEWVRNPEGIRVEYEYDNYGNVEEMRAPGGLISTADYDAGSRLKEFINPNSQRTTYDYDDRNLTTEVTRHMVNPDPLDVTTLYDFDGNGNLEKITNAMGGETEMEYNDFDWLEREQFGGAVRRYEYYTDGKLKKITRADGQPLNYAYDPETNLLTSDGYASYEYDDLNRLQSVTKDGKSIVYTYDDLNRIRTIAYDGRTVTYSYDENSNVERINYGIPNIYVDYRYDDNDRLQEVEDWLGNITRYTYLRDGRLSYATFPNGTRSEYYYDVAGRMDSMVNKAGNIIINAYGFTLDNLGNHTQERKTEPYGEPVYANINETGTYDGRNQVENYGGVDFTHDANGNIKQMSGAWNISNIEWDKHDMPTRFTGSSFSAEYEYDGLGHRRSATRGTEETKYGLDILGMSRVLFEADANGNPTQYYVYGLGMISRIKASDNSERYYHYDFRGSTIAMTDENASITHQYQYDAFGRTMEMQEEDLNCFRYVGGFGVMQENERMLFMRARYYDTEMGRFLSEDPVWSDNLYAYSGNNGLNIIDPNGRSGIVVSGYMMMAYEIIETGAGATIESGVYTWHSVMAMQNGDIHLASTYATMSNEVLSEAWNPKNINSIWQKGYRGAISGAASGASDIVGIFSDFIMPIAQSLRDGDNIHEISNEMGARIIIEGISQTKVGQIIWKSPIMKNPIIESKVEDKMSNVIQWVFDLSIPE